MPLDVRWCPTCAETTLPTDRGVCGWCDQPFPRNRVKRKDLGRPRTVTVEQVEEAYAWYEEGLSLRGCAARLLPATRAASAGALAETLRKQWQLRGYQLRDRVEAMVKASTIHGRARRGENRDPQYRHDLRVRLGQIRAVRCLGLTKTGDRCRRPALAGGEYCVMHDPERREPLLAALADSRRRRAEARDSDGSDRTRRDRDVESFDATTTTTAACVDGEAAGAAGVAA